LNDFGDESFSQFRQISGNSVDGGGSWLLLRAETHDIDYLRLISRQCDSLFSRLTG
jgi:hypothetical protein